MMVRNIYAFTYCFSIKFGSFRVKLPKAKHKIKKLHYKCCQFKHFVRRLNQLLYMYIEKPLVYKLQLGCDSDSVLKRVIHHIFFLFYRYLLFITNKALIIYAHIIFFYESGKALTYPILYYNKLNYLNKCLTIIFIPCSISTTLKY